MLDGELSQQVMEELAWDPRVDAAAVAVAADAGRVTLRGTVGSFAEKREATRIARGVVGVDSVNDRLEVRLLTKHARLDADLRGDVLQALLLDSGIPATIDARVDGGQVTLSGTASWHFQREEAVYVVGNVAGVTGVQEEIELRTAEPSSGDVKKAIRNALRRDARVDADLLAVDVEQGTITVTGVVGSWPEHDAVLAAAWAAPGVVSVEDHVVVGP